jgi:hypothetical protein
MPGTSPPSQGGGVRNEGGTVNVVSTIIGYNTTIGAASTEIEFSGNVTTASHVLLTDNTGSNLAAANPDANGNLVGTATAPINPGLLPLANNGGPTLTLALQPNSPAINAGSNPDGLTTDQTGLTPRVLGGAIDIGAFEFSGNTPVAPASTGPVRETIMVQVVRVRGRRQLRVIDAVTGAQKFALYPFGKGFAGSFQVTMRDVDGDGIADVVVTARRHGKRITLAFSGHDGTALPGVSA